MLRTLLALAAALVIAVGCQDAPAASPLGSDPGGLPSVFIESPATGATIAVGQVLEVSIRGEDVRGVSRLDLRVGDVLVDSASTPNASAERTFTATLDWTPSAEGTVTVSALAYRPTGTGSLPATIQVSVLPSTGVVSPTPAFPRVTPSPGAPTAGPTAEPNSPAEPTRAPRPTTPPAPPTRPPKTPAPPTQPPPTQPPATQPPATQPPAQAAIDLRIFHRERDIPSPWFAGQETVLPRIVVINNGTKPSPEFTIRARLGGGDLVRLRVDAGAIAAGERGFFSVSLAVPNPGTRTLRLEARLLDGADGNPADNIFTMDVEVAPAPGGSPAP